MAKIPKLKEMNFNEFFLNMFLNGKEYEVEVNRIVIRASLMGKPKGIGVGVTKTHGDYHGCSQGVRCIEQAISVIRSNYRSVAGVDLPEVELPPERTWYVYICRGQYYPFTVSRYKPNKEDFTISDPQTGSENECFFDIPSAIAPELSDFPRQGNTVFIPEYSVWHFTDYIEPVKVNHDHYRS